ncbi:MAG: hypothetical protein AAB437_03310 [Patescibacteria group bacterium]
MTEAPPPASAEIKTTQFTAIQALEFGRAQDAASTDASEAFLGKLQGLREADKGKEAFADLRIGDKEASRISASDVNKLQEIGKTGDEDDQAMKENRQRAETLKKQLQAVDIYCELTTRAQAENRKPGDILTEMKRIETWQQIEKTALELLRDQPVVRTMSKNAGEREKIVKEMIAKDPKFRAAFAEAVKGALSRIDMLQKVTEPTEIKAKTDKRDELKENTSRRFTLLKQSTGLEDQDLQDLILQGHSEDVTLDDIFRRALLKEGVAEVEITVIEKHIKTEADIVKLDKAIDTLGDEIGGLTDNLRAERAKPPRGGKEAQSNFDERIRGLEVEKSQKENDLKNKQKEKNRLQGVLDSLLPEMKNKIAIYKSLEKKIGVKNEAGERKKTAVGDDVGKLLTEYPELKRLIKEVKDLASQNEDYQRQLTQRGLLESDILRQLEVSFNDSIVDLIDKRFDEMTELDKKRLVKEQDEGLKKFDEWLEKRYVEFDTNKRREIHHRVTTGEDMRLVAWYGNDGVKRIAAKHLGYSTDPSTWTDEQKINIDKIFDKKGQDIKKKLFTSYFKERTFLDKSFRLRKPFSKEFLFDGGVGDLTLTEAEWGRLGEHFGSEIEAGLSSSKEAQTFLKGLKEKGINPNWNLKWLLWILVILGIIGGVGFLATKGG